MIAATKTNESIWNRPALARFNGRGTDLAVLVRPVRFELDERIQAVPFAEYRAAITPFSAEKHVNSAVRCIGLSDVEALNRDVVEIAEGFLRHFELESAHFRLEIVDRQSCPKFHRDNLHVRMLVTYAGPGTEYVPAHDESAIHHAPREAIILMKGRKHPTDTGAILHRSPELRHGQRRLCLTIDY